MQGAHIVVCQCEYVIKDQQVPFQSFFFMCFLVEDKTSVSVEADSIPWLCTFCILLAFVIVFYLIVSFIVWIKKGLSVIIMSKQYLCHQPRTLGGDDENCMARSKIFSTILLICGLSTIAAVLSFPDNALLTTLGNITMEWGLKV